MKAITYTQYGGPDVLRLVDVEILEPAAGQVRVRVHAASVNPVDVKLRRGDMATVMPATFPVIPGIDLAGVVDAVGEDVGHIRAGDAVLGFAVSGSYADYALASVVAVKPKALDWELAASVPTVGETAARVLRQLGLTTGQTLLVHGAAGSVGAVVTQLAVRRGLTVIGSTGPAGEETVRAHGATPVAYGDGLVARVRALARSGVDGVLDASGRGVLPESIELTGSPDRVITIADMSAQSLGVRFSGGGGSERAFDALPDLAQAAAAGELQIPVWRTYPLAQASNAHADLEAGANRGKIVLIP